MTHIPEALAWTLLHFIWQAVVIAALYRVIDWGLQQKRTDVRYAAALVALICMLGSSLATFLYEQTRLNHNAVSDISTAVAVIGSTAERASLLHWFYRLIGTNANQILRWVDLIWLTGVFVFTLRALGGAWRLSRFRTMPSFEAVGDLAAKFSAIAQKMAVNGRVMLRIHPAAEMPFVAGLFRSVIYLPISALTSLTPDQLDTILIHELAHVRRADYVWNLMQTMMETLFFFHPVVWWLGKVLRERRELCCDDIVIAVYQNPFIYAKALLALAEHKQVRPQLAMALDGHQGASGLFGRVARILGETRLTKSSAGPATTRRFLVSAFAGIAIIYGSLAGPLSAHLPMAQPGHAAFGKTARLPSTKAATFKSDALPVRSNRPEIAELKIRSTSFGGIPPIDRSQVQGYLHSTSSISTVSSSQQREAGEEQATLATADHSAHEHQHQHHEHDHHHHHEHSVATG